MSTQPTAQLSPHTGRLVPRQDPTHVPACQRCTRPMTLVGESDSSWQWGCYPCGCAHVFSKPRAVAAARYRVQMERAAEHARRIRQRESRIKDFLLGGK